MSQIKHLKKILYVFIKIKKKKKIIIWDAGITVFAVPTLFFSCTRALTLFILITVYIDFLLWVNTLMEEMDATSLKSGRSITQIFASQLFCLAQSLDVVLLMTVYGCYSSQHRNFQLHF
jgi:hypothetical protein